MSITPQAVVSAITQYLRSDATTLAAFCGRIYDALGADKASLPLAVVSVVDLPYVRALTGQDYVSNGRGTLDVYSDIVQGAHNARSLAAALVDSLDRRQLPASGLVQLRVQIEAAPILSTEGDAFRV